MLRVTVKNTGRVSRHRLGVEFPAKEEITIDVSNREYITVKAVKDFEIIEKEDLSPNTENDDQTDGESNNEDNAEGNKNAEDENESAESNDEGSEDNSENSSEDTTDDAEEAFQDLTVDEAVKAVENGEYDVDEAIKYEKNGKERSTLIEKLEGLKEGDE
ncbi:hypothetical protein ACTWP4_18665 [Gracilibacillus sp. D59]|uniref:hypothetical protein n=1 Tax=Gracilibacillus sp. D59 TaxID=3457434 RepID=UPI003FCD6C6D